MIAYGPVTYDGNYSHNGYNDMRNGREYSQNKNHDYGNYGKKFDCGGREYSIKYSDNKDYKNNKHDDNKRYDNHNKYDW